MSFHDPKNSVYLDRVKTTLEAQEKAATDAVNKAIKDLEDNANDPSKLARLQHSINKWSLIYNISSTTTRAIKDILQSILQKV